jgi:DNA-binding NarL/FixJ family response regulator
MMLFYKAKADRNIERLEDARHDEIKSSIAASYNLTKREIEVLGERINGLSNKEIGEQFFISEGTVKNHFKNIAKKAGKPVRKILIEIK